MRKQAAGKDATKEIIKVFDAQGVKAQSPKFSQRDKELNEALLHIMRVRNTLEWQYKILSESAINT